MEAMESLYSQRVQVLMPWDEAATAVDSAAVHEGVAAMEETDVAR
jgi:hypothetical protein